LIDRLIVEDIAPTYTAAEGFPEYVAAMKRVSFSPTLKNISHARKFANKQLCETFPVTPCVFRHIVYL